MRYLLILVCITFLFTLNGCLTYFSIEYRIVFNEDFKTGNIDVFYTDIRSSEEEAKKRQEDFTALLDMYQGDNFLLDNLGDGIYIKERKLYEKDGRIDGQFSGIFKKLKIDGEELFVLNEERLLIVKDPDDSKFETNGKVLRSENNIIIVWPKGMKEIYWKKSTRGEYVEDTYPMIDYYREWKK